MPTKTYDFNTVSEYSLISVDLTGGLAQLASSATSGTILGTQLFNASRIDSVAATENLNGGTILYGLEVDTLLMWHDGVSWVPSDGSPAQLNTLAQLQANAGSALGPDIPIVRPYIRLGRALPLNPSPTVDDLTIVYTVAAPNRQFMLANDAAVALNVGVGGAASPGQTRVTLDLAQIEYNPGSNNLWVFRNGVLQVASAYIEEDSSHVVFDALLDATGPFIDELEFRVANQGSSAYLPPPTYLVQARPPTRPDNFGGNFEFS